MADELKRDRSVYAPDELPTPGQSGLSQAERERNAKLLADYNYSRYPQSVTGFNGMNLQKITRMQSDPAVRVRVGERGNYKGAIARLSDESLVLAVCRRKTDAGLFEIRVYASDDLANSWTQINQAELFGKEMCLVALPDDSLVMTVESKMFVEGTTRMAIYRSTDRGITWTTHVIDGPETPRSMIVEKDSSLTMVRAHASAYHEPLYQSCNQAYQPDPHLEILRSNNGGRNWTRTRGEVAWNNSRFGEVSAVRFENGNLLASLRSNPPGTEHEASQVTYLTESTDDGRHWCEPWIITNVGEVQVHLLLLDNGQLLATYTNYHLPFGVCAIVSDDAGRTWNHDTSTQLAISADSYTGWPTTVALKNGDLVTSYAITAYLNEPSDPGGAQRNVCETVRWRLPAR